MHMRKKIVVKRFLPMCCKGKGVKPVSYTHLDVYKRQEYKKALVRPITGTLVEFSRKIDREATITDIAIKYRVDETKSYHKTFTAVAVWRIGISDGTYYYHNARQ